MDLFEAASRSELERKAPLAERMRPRNLDEFVGQARLVGKGAYLRRLLEGDRIHSLILYGEPGTGKTTLAKIAASMTSSHFESLNAVTSGVSDIRRVIEEARERRSLYGKGTILFIDEIHRFNKAQQDALLPAVEDGTVTLIGATTENPYFQVNAPLLSRARVVRLEPLTPEDIRTIARRALADPVRGLGSEQLTLDEDAEEHLVRIAGGDARVALNTLEHAAAAAAARGESRITLAVVEEVAQQAAVRYDKDGDHHYDVISAFIKSMRGSDPDATLYWLARMLEAGEDPRFISRRIVIHASEDVGNADPMALVVANAAAETVERVGLPEGQLALAQAALYVATAPKSNAVYVGIHEARQDVRGGRVGPVPRALRDSSYAGAKALGHGAGYLYPHDDPTGYVRQNYWPEGMEPRTYYRPPARGYEAVVRDRLEQLRQR